ncbi:MAG: hypothetical protein K2Z81_07005 [Cyanobacteria bacterium]|nr:hypothetical protein [Cyanobacteriota bacterium]
MNIREILLSSPPQSPFLSAVGFHRWVVEQWSMPQKKTNPSEQPEDRSKTPATTDLVTESIRQGQPPRRVNPYIGEPATTNLVTQAVEQSSVPQRIARLFGEPASTNLVAESIRQGAISRRADRFVGESALFEFGQQLLKTEPNPAIFSGTLGQMLYEDRLRERLKLPPHSEAQNGTQGTERFVGEQVLREFGQEVLRTAPNKNIFSGTLGEMFYEELLRERLQLPPKTAEPPVEPRRGQ